MKDLLKEQIEDLVKTSVNDFKSNNSLPPRRIVLYTSHEIRQQTLIFNYTQNRFYNQQDVIDKKVHVEIIPWYKPERHREDGDYIIDMGIFLIGVGVDPKSYFDV